MAKKRKRYTAEFKAEAMRLVEQRGTRSVADVAASLGVAESVLHAWKRTTPAAAAQHDRGESPEQELARLRRENADLRRDRDALVKSIAVFVKDRK
jgi:transposase